ncbi:MAG: hypothetical protein R8P61_06275 [Bacteroidia bacterium]|nr:hypothetical protein [Bacteroidia bacterium]
MQEQENTEKSELDLTIELTKKAEEFLALASKWARIIAIISFIFIASYLLFALIGTLSTFGGNEGSERGGFLLLVAIILGGIYVIPSLYLFRFARSSKSALEAKDEIDLEKSLHALGISFRLLGFILILFAILYVAGMLIVINDISMILR